MFQATCLWASVVPVLRKNKIGVLTLPGVKAHHKATLIMTISYKKRQVDHWNTVENPEIHAIFTGHYFLLVQENIMGTKTVFSTNGDMKM